MKLLDGKTAIITELQEVSVKVLHTSLLNKAQILLSLIYHRKKKQALESELSAFGITAKGFKSDASDFDSAQQLAADVIEIFGSIDIVVITQASPKITCLCE